MDAVEVEKKKEEIEPEVVPSIHPSPPSKAVSTCSGEVSERARNLADENKVAVASPMKMMKTPENFSSSKMNGMKPLPVPSNVENPTMDKSSAMYSSVNLLSGHNNMHGIHTRKPMESCFSANVKLGLIQLLLSLLLSAFGGLLIAKNASLSMLGSGIWSGIFAGICGALGLFNIQPLINGFLACSLISIATSTTALAFTGIGLVRDYNFSQSDPGVEPAVFAACGLTLLLVLHLFTSLFSVYHSALELCSNKNNIDEEVVVMNYEKVQKYLKSLQAAGISSCDLDGYQNYINNAKMQYQQRKMPANVHPHYYNMLMYPPPTVSSIYMTNSRMSYPNPYHYPYQPYPESHYSTYDEIKHQRTMEKPKRKRLPTAEQKPKEEQENLAYTGVDRDLAESYLKSIEPKE